MKNENLEKAISLRHELHRYPELSCRETETLERLKTFIHRNTSLRVVDKGSWFYAWYRPCGEGKSEGKQSGSGGRLPDAPADEGPDLPGRRLPAVNGEGGRELFREGHEKSEKDRRGKWETRRPGIAFRADIDALPIRDEIDTWYRSKNEGVGHKCGHDGHAAVLAALALEVDIEGADRDVYFLFQHGEETGAGAKECIEIFQEHNISEIYAFHNMPGISAGTVAVREGTMHFASRGLSLSFKGREAHASLPEEGINPSFAIARVILFIEELSRREDFEGLVLITIVQVDIGKKAFGTAAGEGILRVTLRAQYEEELNGVHELLLAACREESKKAFLEFSFEEEDVFPETVNDPACVRKVRAVCEGSGIPVMEMKEAFRASEDFGHYLKERPGCIFFLGDGEDSPKLHTPAFDFPDEIIETAVEIFKGLIPF